MAHVIETVRGSDRKKQAEWNQVEPVYSFTGEHDGWYIGRIKERLDCDRLGLLMGHCAGGHWGWMRDNITFFFSVFDKDDVPHTTLHAKRTSQLWLSQKDEEKKCEQFRQEWSPQTWANGHVLSTAYDPYVEDLEHAGRPYADSLKQNLEYLQEQVKNVQARYEREKELALMEGPLGPNNPRKWVLDDWNRSKNNMSERFKKAQAEYDAAVEKNIRYTTGRRVLFEKRDIIVLSDAAKGYGFSPEYLALTTEWLDSLPSRDGQPVRDTDGKYRSVEYLYKQRKGSRYY